jgi:hypothetical protein
MPKKPGKWAKIVPGHLYGWKKDQSDTRRHAILNKAVKKDSYATITRRLNQLRNVTKDRETKRIVQKDMEYLKQKCKR